MRRPKQRNSKISVLPACGIGIGLTLVVFLLLISVGAIFILNEYIDQSVQGIMAGIIQFLSVIPGAFAAAKLVSEKKIIVCCAVSGFVYFVLICCALLFGEGLSGNVFSGFLTSALGCSVAIFLSCGNKKRTIRTGRGKRYC